MFRLHKVYIGNIYSIKANKFEGDINGFSRLRNQNINAKGAVSRYAARWPNGTVPYLITEIFSI